MDQRIEYKGMTSQPSDYQCSDGEMKLAVNAEFRNDGYKAVRVPSEVEFKNNNFIPLFVHEPSGNESSIYIGTKYNDDDNYSLGAITEDGIRIEIENNTDYNTPHDVDNFCAIGNIIVFTLAGKIKYAYFKDGKYMIFDRLPTFVNIYFAAARNDVTEQYKDSKYTIFRRLAKLNSEGHSFITVSNLASEYFEPVVVGVDKASDDVFSVFNEIVEKAKNLGRLIFPSIVRYAIRLYDGSHIQVSPPILLYPLEDCVALNGCSEITGEVTTESPMYLPPDKIKVPATKTDDTAIFFSQYKICFTLTEQSINAINELKKMGNIVSGIDFYLSPQIYTINTNRAVAKFSVTDYYPTFIKTRQFENADKITDYYLVKSYSVDELIALKKGQYIDLLDEKDFWKLKMLEQQEKFEDNLYSNSDIFVGGTNSYNSRLNIFDIKKVLPELVDMNIMCPPILGLDKKHDGINASMGHGIGDWSENIDFFVPTNYIRHDYSEGQDDFPNDLYQEFDVNVKKGLYYCLTPHLDNYGEDNKKNDLKVSLGIKIENSTGTKSETNVSDIVQKYLPLYFSYPAIGVKNLYATSKNYNGSSFEGKIAMHDSDNSNQSSYFFKNAELLRGNIMQLERDEVFPSNKKNMFVEYRNLIKLSDVNNPFVFKDGNSAQCGEGTVLSLASNSRAVSQGQFGQYPLYAFCTDGVYAIGVGTDGTLQNCSPFSYDILSDANSVSNMESSVVFVTKQGIISLGGEGRQLLLPADPTATYNYDTCKGNHQATFMQKAFTNVLHLDAVPQMVDLYTYLTTGARIAYDYPHGRLIVYNQKHNYSYVMEAASGMWSIMTQGFHSNLNVYEECLMVKEVSTAEDHTQYKVYNYSSDKVVEAQKAYLITRPFKLGYPDVHKTLHSLIQRGVFCSKDDVKQALYGSNDLYNWVPVWSSSNIYLRGFRGTGYKYYRLMLFLPEFKQNETLQGTTITFAPRMTDMQR